MYEMFAGRVQRGPVALEFPDAPRLGPWAWAWAWAWASAGSCSACLRLLALAWRALTHSSAQQVDKYVKKPNVQMSSCADLRHQFQTFGPRVPHGTQIVECDRGLLSA